MPHARRSQCQSSHASAMRSNTVPFPVVLLVALLACQALFTAVLAQNETASVSIVTMGYTPVGDTLADTGVKAKDYPNVALISIKTKTGQTTTCTGLIIQVDKVPVLLTAAHCASDSTRKNSAISVVIGLDTESQFSTMCDTKDFPTCRKFKTLKIIQHPMYGHPKCDPQGTVDTMGYDVALWVLTPKNKNIPLKIDSKYLRINDKTSVPPSSSDVPITAIGWGQINVGNAQMMKAAATSFVHKTDLTLRKDPSECEKLYKLCPGSGPRFACVSNKAGDSTCNGDSGGPLYYKDLVWAITSFGSSKCGDGKPGVVLRTSGFYHWVQVTLKEINSDKEFLASQKA